MSIHVPGADMSSLYPSLEDMQVHKVIVAQENAAMNAHTNANACSQRGYPYLTNNAACTSAEQSNTVAALYPGLGDFMGLELSQDVIALNMPEYMQFNQAVSVTPMISSIVFFFPHFNIDWTESMKFI